MNSRQSLNRPLFGAQYDRCFHAAILPFPHQRVRVRYLTKRDRDWQLTPSANDPWFGHYGEDGLLSSRHILIVEDEAEIRSIVARMLEGEGTHLVEASNGAEADAALQTQRFDLVLLDLKLPDVDGLDILRRLRQRSMVPVIVLTGQSEEVDQILGLELGADDYVIKPFSKRVLLARMKNAMRRSEPKIAVGDKDQTYYVDAAGWRFDLAQPELISPNDDHVPLTGAECRLLRTLLDHRDQLVSREELSLEVLGRKLKDSRSIDALIARLRAKFRAVGVSTSIIHTVHGVGYELSL